MQIITDINWTINAFTISATEVKHNTCLLRDAQLPVAKDVAALKPGVVESGSTYAAIAYNEALLRAQKALGSRTKVNFVKQLSLAIHALRTMRNAIVHHCKQAEPVPVPADDKLRINVLNKDPEFVAERKAKGPRHPDNMAKLKAAAKLEAVTARNLMMKHAFFGGKKPSDYTKEELVKLTGFREGNSKIHGSTNSLHPLTCPRGAKLAQCEGTVCHGCYASAKALFRKEPDLCWLRNYYIAKAMVEESPITREVFIELTVEILRRHRDKKLRDGDTEVLANLVRWLSAGDIFSKWYLVFIVEVCKRTPEMQHWLPTRERGTIRRFMEENEIPANLNIRLSDDKLDTPIDQVPGCTASSVHTKRKSAGAAAVVHGFACPAYAGDGTCGTCTACWDKSVARVSYPKH